MTIPFDISGPVEGEVFIVAREGERLVLTGPDGPRAWRIEVHGQQNPMEELREVVMTHLPDLALFHSTSWRWEREAVVLTFIGVAGYRPGQEAREVPRVELARGEATAAPSEVGGDQVLNHALRHLAWLAREDEVVAATLDTGWKALLSRFVPATFSQLEVPCSK